MKDEDLETGFDFSEAASLTDGYSGSDLKNLAVAAAYRPIQDVLRAEEKAREAAQAAEKESDAKENKGKEVALLDGADG